MKGLQHTVMPLTHEDYLLGRNEEAPLFQPPEGTALLSLSRGAFQHVARNLKCEGRRVLLPAYTCITVPRPFLQEGWEVEYFLLDEGMRIVPEDFLGKLESFRPDVVIVHPYYGQDLNDAERTLLRKAKAQGCFILKDLTQCIGATQKEDFADAYTGSLRKWFPIPDGAFYYSKVLPLNDSVLEENTEFVTGFRDAQYVSNQYVQQGHDILYGIATRINTARGEGMASSYTDCLFRMSDFSRRILHKWNFRDYNHRCMENARYLWENLKDSALCKMVYRDISDITTGPLFFPVYMNTDRKDFRLSVLSPAKIKGVTMWCGFIKKLPEEVADQVAPLYDDMLQLPIGLDYGKEEMDRIIACLK